MKRFLVLMGIATLLGLASDARAGVAISTSSDGGTTWVSQALTGGSTEANADVAAASVVVGGVTFTGLHLSTTFPGSALSAILNSTSGTASGSGVALVAFSVSGYTLPIGANTELTSVSATGTSGLGGKAVIQSWATSPGALVLSGAFPAALNPVGPVSVTVANGVSGGSPTATKSISPALGTPFTLITVVAVDLDGGSNGISFNGTAQVAVPEPTSMALLGCGVVSMLGYGWKRRKATA